MAPRQEDFILRIIEQLGAALRRIRELLSRDTPAAEEALAEIQAAQGMMFGERAHILDQLDPATAVSLIADGDEVTRWIELIRLEASASRLLGEIDRADELDRRAAELGSAAGKVEV